MMKAIGFMHVRHISRQMAQVPETVLRAFVGLPNGQFAGLRRGGE